MKILLMLLLVAMQQAHGQEVYSYTADLLHIEDDKIAVQLTPPHIKEDEIVFSFPKVIPGSYDEKNFYFYWAAVPGRRFSNSTLSPSRVRWLQPYRKTLK